MGSNSLWSAEERDYLDLIAGTDHVVALCQRYCRMASLKGWPKRTDSAIKDQLSVLGYSWRPEIDGWSGCGLARILGVGSSRVNSWCQRGRLASSKIDGFNVRRIFRSDLEVFAKKYPRSLRDIDELRLKSVLDSKIVDFIMTHKPRYNSIRVYSSRTGRIYENIKDASKKEYCCQQSISLSIKNNRPTKSGIQFIKVGAA